MQPSKSSTDKTSFLYFQIIVLSDYMSIKSCRQNIRDAAHICFSDIMDHIFKAGNDFEVEKTYQEAVLYQ